MLWDWEHFSDWWPRPVTVKQKGIRFQPIPFLHIEWVRLDGKPFHTVRYQYTRGPFRGEGVWQIDENPHRPGWIHVQYAVCLYPVNWLVKMLASTWAFRFKHERDIQSILKRMCDKSTRR